VTPDHPDLNLLPQVHVAMGEAEVRLASALGVSPREASVIGYLSWSTPPVAGRDIRRRFGLSPAGTTELLDRLEAAGHVDRRRWEHDARVTQIRVTDTTAERIAALLAPLLEQMNRLFQELDPAESATIRRFLTTAISISDAFRPSQASNENPTAVHASSRQEGDTPQAASEQPRTTH